MKKLLTIAMISLAALAAKADLTLYWQVDPSGFDSAQYATIETTDGAIMSFMELTPGYVTKGESGLENSFTSGVAYWVALYDASRDKIAISDQSYDYSTIIAHTKRDETAPEIDSPMSVSGFTSTIPEPTSSLMLLLGLGALALKRKVS